MTPFSKNGRSAQRVSREANSTIGIRTPSCVLVHRICLNLALNLFTTADAMISASSIGVDPMSADYSLSDVLQRIYENQLAFEAAVIELTLWVEQRASPEVGNNIRGALGALGHNAGRIKQGLARLRA